MPDPFRVYIGWDRREAVAYEVAKFSLERRSSIAVSVLPVKLDELRARGLYWREPDPLAATEFTYSRFLVPALAGYEGWALFCDCDFLWLSDIAYLEQFTDIPKAVHCVQHDYRPQELVKMEGAVQTVYPRKNWSSLMLLDCGHPSVRRLTPEVVNTSSGAFLHRMQWVLDEDIGALPGGWNWLEGWDEKPPNGITPCAVHFTRGGPWFERWRGVEYGELWQAERAAMEKELQR